MPDDSLSIQNLNELREYIRFKLCEREELELGAFRLTESILTRSGQPCGMFFGGGVLLLALRFGRGIHSLHTFQHLLHLPLHPLQTLPQCPFFHAWQIALGNDIIRTGHAEVEAL